MFLYPCVQAEQRTRAVHLDHRLTRSSICSFFLNKMPHLIKLHDAHRLNFSALGSKALNIIAQLFYPAHHGCMRNACDPRYTPKPHTFKIETNAFYAYIKRRTRQAGACVITSTILALITLFITNKAVFGADGAPTMRTGHTKS